MPSEKYELFTVIELYMALQHSLKLKALKGSAPKFEKVLYVTAGRNSDYRCLGSCSCSESLTFKYFPSVQKKNYE